MRFLLDADLSPRLVPLFEEYGHEAVHVEKVLAPRSVDALVASLARDTDRCLFTGDFDFSDMREFEPRNYPGIVVLTLPRDAGAPYIVALVREFLAELPRLGNLRGKLLIVEPGRIRMRE